MNDFLETTVDTFLQDYRNLMRTLRLCRENNLRPSDEMMSRIYLYSERLDEGSDVLDDILNTYRLPARKNGPFDLHKRLNDLLECLQDEINNSIAPDMQHLMEELLQCAAMASRLGYAVRKKEEGATVLVGPDPRTEKQPVLTCYVNENFQES